MIGAEVDIPQMTGLGIGAAVLTLVFRTLWRQDDGWRSVLDAARADAKQAREDAAVARTDASVARGAENECRARLAKLEHEMGQLQDLVADMQRTPKGD